MMKIVCIDPGAFTGFVAVQLNPNLLANNAMNFVEEAHTFTKDGISAELNTYLTTHEVDRIIIERSPIYGEQKQSQLFGEVVAVILRHGVEMTVFAPGDWKPIAKARSWKHRSAANDHENDAYNLLRYYCWITYKTDIGELDWRKL